MCYWKKTYFYKNKLDNTILSPLSIFHKKRGCLKREADVFLTKFNFIKRRLCFGNFKSFRNMVVETI